jgi:hypothetical protein
MSDEHSFALREADRARSDFTAIEGDLQFRLPSSCAPEGKFAVDSPVEEAGFELMVPPAIFCATATVSKPVFRTRLAAGGKRIRTCMGLFLSSSHFGF